MKANVKKTLGMAALGMTLLATTTSTWAGSVNTPEVSISGGSAGGTMVGARYSADSTQYIGCFINVANAPPPFIKCEAFNSARNYLGCISYDAIHIDSVQRMTDSSSIHFYADRATGRCTNVTIQNYSYQLK